MVGKILLISGYFLFIVGGIIMMRQSLSPDMDKLWKKHLLRSQANGLQPASRTEDWEQQQARLLRLQFWLALIIILFFGVVAPIILYKLGVW